jgi:hypothetical protein
VPLGGRLEDPARILDVDPSTAALCGGLVQEFAQFTVQRAVQLAQAHSMCRWTENAVGG